MESSSSSSSERPQTSELFICFTSRLSSSMKLSSSASKSSSILSPGRQISLSSSLSRRLRSSGSLKGAASPMFPAGGKKRSGGGASFDTPEPSSPKVTCIGQVRVKTKMQAAKNKSKKKKKISRSRSSSSIQQRRTPSFSAGEASFRRSAAEHESNENASNHVNNGITSSRNANKYWVNQLPGTICEALREFNCFLPCRSSCTKDSERKRAAEESAGSGGGGGNGGRSCGAVFARWLVAVQDGDGKGREIELVVGEDEEEEEEPVVAAAAEKEVKSGSQRRRVFEGIEFKDLEAMAAREEASGGGGKEDAARISLCVPPKNALLLMRCRSDPVKMAALATKFWESPAPKKLEHDDEEVREVHETVVIENQTVETTKKCLDVKKEEESSVVVHEHKEKAEACNDGHADCEEDDESQVLEQDSQQVAAEVDHEKEENEVETESPEIVEETDFSADRDIVNVEQEDNEVELRNEDDHECDSLERRETLEDEEQSSEKDAATDSYQAEQEEPVKQTQKEEEKEEETAVEVEEADSQQGSTEEEEEEEEELRRQPEPEKTGPVDPTPKVELRESQGLPDCLLLMMCEPKLSMEVSKETWVCTTDFIRWLPERRRPAVTNPKPAPEPQPEKTRRRAPKPPAKNADAGPVRPPAIQPPRSSCSLPAAASMLERKLAPYEPFSLTRCKSEPMRSASKLAAVAAAPPPENSSCLWKNRKMEAHHHRPPTVGVGGGAGVGF